MSHDPMTYDRLVTLTYKPAGVSGRKAELRYRAIRTDTDGSVLVWGPMTKHNGTLVDHPKARYWNVQPDTITEEG